MYANETDTVAKIRAPSSYPGMVPRLYNVCELDFLMIYFFPQDFSLDIVFVFRPKTHPLISGDYSFAVFQVTRTLNDFLNGGSNL